MSPLPTAQWDWKPVALVPLLAALALPLVGSPSTWLTLTVAGLAMGLIIFIIASGLTLVFGLMDVLNFGHGVFIALGAFVATTVLGGLQAYTLVADWWPNLLAMLAAMAVAMAVAAAVGLAFERFIVRPVYGQHLKQILITMGGMIIAEELIKVIWGPQQIPLPLPAAGGATRHGAALAACGSTPPASAAPRAAVPPAAPACRCCRPAPDGARSDRRSRSI